MLNVQPAAYAEGDIVVSATQSLPAVATVTRRCGGPAIDGPYDAVLRATTADADTAGAAQVPSQNTQPPATPAALPTHCAAAPTLTLLQPHAYSAPPCSEAVLFTSAAPAASDTVAPPVAYKAPPRGAVLLAMSVPLLIVTMPPFM
jgi:hypothetical protein